MDRKVPGGRALAPPPGVGRAARSMSRGRSLRTPSATSPSQSTETPAAEIPPPATARTGRSSALRSGPPKARQCGFARGLQTEQQPSNRRTPVPGPDQPSTSAVSSPSLPAPAPVLKLGIDLNAVSAALPVIPLPRRPDRGSAGREIHLVSNLFKLDFTDMFWYKFDVEIMTATEAKLELATAAGTKLKDRIQSRQFNRDIIDELFRKHARELCGHLPAYDGRKTLICAKKFFDEHIFTVDMIEGARSRQFVVKMRCVLTIDVSQIRKFYEDRSYPLSPEILQAVNIVIDSSLARIFVAVNRSYYANDQTIRGIPLTGGKELRSGIYTSSVFAEFKPLLLVDKSNTAFYTSGNLIDYISHFLNDPKRKFIRAGIPRQKLMALTKDLKGLTVKLKHSTSKRTVKIHGFTEAPASRIEFQQSDGSKTTVARYFEERYNQTYGRLRYPDLPCLTAVRPKAQKTDFFPLEVCEIKPNQPVRRALNSDQTKIMIRNCQEKPHQRINLAIENVRTIQRTSNPVLKQHGVGISKLPVETVGRQIPSPSIRVKDLTIPVENGKWTQEQFHEGAKLDRWCVVDCAGVGRLSRDLATMMFNAARRMQLDDVEEPLCIIDGARMNPRQILEKVRTLRKPEEEQILAVIILGDSPIYSQLKYLSEATPDFAGIITSCVKAKTVQGKLNRTLVENLLKKINAKLGGTNSEIVEVPKRFAQEHFIVIGADVSHPGAGDIMTPSIAGVVGSIDTIPSKYATEIRVQTNDDNNRIEYIKDLQDVAAILLRKHRAATNRIPERIYYIRDGVSDGQFPEVRLREITALREACKSLGSGDYRPKMTVLIAQKRHHTRFNVKDRLDATKSGNIPPGTYIDRDVVHPENFDFFMYTHQGLVGTSRPTHYQIIYDDEPKITADEVTEIIYYLSMCYARTSSSVSIPAPIYYAHLAAFRAKEHVKGKLTLSGSDTRSTSSGDDASSIDLPEYQKMCDVNLNYRQRLYYV